MSCARGIDDEGGVERAAALPGTECAREVDGRRFMCGVVVRRCAVSESSGEAVGREGEDDMDSDEMLGGEVGAGVPLWGVVAIGTQSR